MPEKAHEAPKRRLENGGICSLERVGALTDGVVAIAATILVLELKIPDHGGELSTAQLHEDLLAQVPTFWSWIISFFLTARFWQEQHFVWARLLRCDAVSVAINFVFLCACSLIPFVADLAGDYPDDPLSVLLFSLVMAANSVSLAVLTIHVHRESLCESEATRLELRHRALYLALIIPLVALLSSTIAYLGYPAAALAVWGLEVMAIRVHTKVSRHIRHRAKTAQ